MTAVGQETPQGPMTKTKWEYSKQFYVHGIVHP